LAANTDQKVFNGGASGDQEHIPFIAIAAANFGVCVRARSKIHEG